MILSRIQNIEVDKKYLKIAEDIKNSWHMTGMAKYDSKRKYAERGIIAEFGVWTYMGGGIDKAIKRYEKLKKENARNDGFTDIANYDIKATEYEMYFLKNDKEINNFFKTTLYVDLHVLNRTKNVDFIQTMVETKNNHFNVYIIGWADIQRFNELGINYNFTENDGTIKPKIGIKYSDLFPFRNYNKF